MGLGKQSKVLNKSQIEMVSNHLRSKRNGLRNQTIFLLSVKSGLGIGVGSTDNVLLKRLKGSLSRMTKR